MFLYEMHDFVSVFMSFVVMAVVVAVAVMQFVIVVTASVQSQVKQLPFLLQCLDYQVCNDACDESEKKQAAHYEYSFRRKHCQHQECLVSGGCDQCSSECAESDHPVRVQ